MATVPTADNFTVDYTPDLADAAPSYAPPVVADLLGSAQPLFILGAYDVAASTVIAAASAPRTDDHSDQAVSGDIARAAYGITGTGIKVGILSDSFDVLGGAAAAVAAGELPAGVQVLEEGAAGSHDEGQAMAELVHRIAPGAQILFHTATDGAADFAAGIDALVAAGCNVIVDDVAYLDEPFFQQGGVVQTAVENAVSSGVSYFTAAGNEGTDYIEQGFAPLHLALPGLPAGAAVQNFGSVAAPRPWLDLTVAPGAQTLLDLQWDQNDSNAAGSLGMALYDSTGALVASATANLAGGTPDQVLTWTNTSQGSAFRLVLYMNGGSVPPGLFKIVAFGGGRISDPDAGTGSGSVIGHEMVPGANTVGAMAWSAAPRFGGSDTPEPYSSVGVGTYLLDASGTPLAAPLSTQKVDFLAPDGSVTSVLAPFDGTSAAAANAAGVAALVLQADPSLAPAQLTQVLEATATPAYGAALATGAGLLQADAAVRMALAIAASGSG